MQTKEIEARLANSEHKTLLSQILTHIGKIKLEVFEHVTYEKNEEQSPLPPSLAQMISSKKSSVSEKFSISSREVNLDLKSSVEDDDVDCAMFLA